MNILHCTDFHGNKRWFDWLTHASDRHDAICLSGDLLARECWAQGEREIPWITDWVRSFPRPLFICSGNHDIVERTTGEIDATWLMALRTERVSVDGDLRRFCDVEFQCVPWFGSPMACGPWAAVITHCPPAGLRTAIARGGASFGDEALRDLLDTGWMTPRFVLSGHVHDPQDWNARTGNVWSFNPGYERSAKTPNHITIDTDESEARFFRHGEMAGRIELRRRWPRYDS